MGYVHVAANEHQLNKVAIVAVQWFSVMVVRVESKRVLALCRTTRSFASHLCHQSRLLRLFLICSASEYLIVDMSQKQALDSTHLKRPTSIPLAINSSQLLLRLRIPIV